MAGSSGRSSRCSPLSANSRVMRPSSCALTTATALSGLRRLRVWTSRQVSPSIILSRSAASSSFSRIPSRRINRG